MNRRRAWLIVCLFAIVMSIIVIRLSFAEETVSNASDYQFGDTVYYASDYQISYTMYYDTEEDRYYLFLPSYTSLDDLRVDFPKNTQVSYACDGNDYGNGFNNLPLGEDIDVTLQNELGTEKYTLQILQCGNLPTIYIETESGHLGSFDRDESEEALAMMVNSDGSMEFTDRVKVTTRGNTTFGMPKNAYNLNFSKDISAWGFDGIDKLCLLANYYDESSLLNLIAYKTAKEKGIKYTSNYQMVNFYANGEYLGLYGIATKQEYKKYIKDDGIMAAFEFAVNDEEDNSFCSENDTYIKVCYGDMEYVRAIVDAFENALLMNDYDRAYQYIDIDSFVEKYAFEEFFENYDISNVGQYFYIDSLGKIHHMCAWDYDRIFGSINTELYNNLTKIEIFALISRYQDHLNFWWRYLLEDEYFRDMVINVLETEYDDVFYQKLFEQIYDWIDEINISWKCDRIRWDSEVGYNAFGYENLDEYASLYDSVICDRSEFLISYLSDPENYCVVGFVNGCVAGIPQFAYICIPYGSRLSDYTEGYNMTEYENLGLALWRTQDNLSVSDVDVVTEDIIFYNTIYTEEEDSDAYDYTEEEGSDAYDDAVLEDVDFNNDIDTLTEDSGFYNKSIFTMKLTFRQLIVCGAIVTFCLISLILFYIWVKNVYTDRR